MKKISEQICNKINTVVESVLEDIIKDISVRYEIDVSDLEVYVLNKKKKQNEFTKYNSKRRKELLKENPNYKFGDMSIIISKEWNKMIDITEEKKK